MMDIIEFVSRVCVLMFPQYYKKKPTDKATKKKDPTRIFEFVLLRKVFFPPPPPILELSPETATFLCNKKNHRPIILFFFCLVACGR